MNDNKVAVVGLGVIGLKLVEYLSLQGYSIVAYNWRNIEAKRAQFQLNIDKKVKYEKVSMEVLEQVKRRIQFTDKLDDIKDCELVIDSTKEIYAVKQELYASLLKVMGKQSVLATTTSSLSLQRLAGYFDKNRFVGMHFFNPPTKMKLIELSFLDSSNMSLQNSVYRFLRTLSDKKVVELPPIQGYIVNRLLFIYINAAISFMEETGLPAQNIDEAMRSGTNVPMGPLELSDYIGNDVTLDILNEFYSSLKDERYKPPAPLVQMVKDGKLGKKVKAGFYNY